MSKVNYIQQKLLIRVNDIKSKLLPTTKSFIQKQTNEIITHLIKYDDLTFKKYDELKEGTEYKFQPDKKVKISPTLIFTNNPAILAKLNILKKVKLVFPSVSGFPINININIYHDESDEKPILNSNINKLITRLWNLFVLFENKSSANKLYTFNWYLYSNVKRGNKKKIGGDTKIYLSHLRKCICFNTQNGLTDMYYYQDDASSSISRLEESMGLLTHEFMHVTQLNNASDLFNWDNNFCIKNTKTGDEGISPLETLEIYTNAFTIIFHSYLYHKETSIQSDLSTIINNEIIYSIINVIRLSNIEGIDLNMIYNRDAANPIIWYQDANIYEYIIGKTLVLLNFTSLSADAKFIDNQFSRTECFPSDSHPELNTYLKDKIKEFHIKNDDILTIYNEIAQLEKAYLIKQEKTDQTDQTCGHMILQYFLYDPIETQVKDALGNMYGGVNYKDKYLKYKIKYLTLKNTL